MNQTNFPLSLQEELGQNNKHLIYNIHYGKNKSRHPHYRKLNM